MRGLAVLPLLFAAGAPPVFQPLGVCAFGDDGAACWDLQGSPLPELTARVDRLARDLTYPLTFVQGRKNRYLIVRQGPVSRWQLFGSGGQVGTFPLGDKGAPDLTALRVATLPSESTATVTAKVGVATEPEGEIALREGRRRRSTGFGWRSGA